MIEQNQNAEQTPFTPVEVVENHQLVLPTEKDFEVVLMGKVDDRIAEVSKELSKLLKGSHTDKKAYNAMKDFKNKIIVKMRTGTSGRADELLEDARKYTNKVHEIKKSIIEKVQTKLEFKAVEWLDVADRIAKEEENRKIKEAQERFDSRLKELELNGVSFNGQWYAINDIAIGKQMLEEMNDEVYADLLAKVKVQNEANIKEAQRKIQEQALLAQQQENLRLENERQKAELDKMKADLELQQKQMADAKKEIREQQLAPYIVFIRDYSGLLGMSDEDYQKEFEDIKKGAQLQWEHDKKQKEEEAKLAEKKEREAKEAQQKLEAERKLLAERALPYEELGFKHNYTKGTWEISIGELYSLEITKIELLENLLSYDIVSKNVSEYRAKEEARLAEVEKQKEDARIKLMNEKDAFNDYITRLLNVQAPNLENEQFRNSIISITSLFKTID